MKDVDRAFLRQLRRERWQDVRLVVGVIGFLTLFVWAMTRGCL